MRSFSFPNLLKSHFALTPEALSYRAPWVWTQALPHPANVTFNSVTLNVLMWKTSVLLLPARWGWCEHPPGKALSTVPRYHYHQMLVTVTIRFQQSVPITKHFTGRTPTNSFLKSQVARTCSLPLLPPSTCRLPFHSSRKLYYPC